MTLQSTELFVSSILCTIPKKKTRNEHMPQFCSKSVSIWRTQSLQKMRRFPLMWWVSTTWKGSPTMMRPSRCLSTPGMIPSHSHQMSNLPGRGSVLAHGPGRGPKELYGLLFLKQWMITSENDVEIQWKFINKKSDYFPSSVKLLLVASKTGHFTHFPFKFRILPTVEMCVRAKWWHPLTTYLGPKKGHHGWSCDIEANYCSSIAMDVFLECRKPREERKISQMLGLGEAVAPYLEALRKPM